MGGRQLNLQCSDCHVTHRHQILRPPDRRQLTIDPAEQGRAAMSTGHPPATSASART